MKKLKVSIPGREYEILTDGGILDRAGEMVRKTVRGGRIALVTDENVMPLYGDRVRGALEKAGFSVRPVVIPAGETSKSMAMLERLYDEFMSFELTRADAVLALGGGVVGDLAGFAAATILRGVDFIQVPTTLLAQVDSSVGGKVAIDLKAGKNLAGAFYQPRLVLIDTDCLHTLPPRELSGGMAEVIKYGAIRDAALFRRLEEAEIREGLPAGTEEIVCRCCDIKREIVERDERDTGERMVLNFGHTLAHAYESAYNFEKYTHGEAVAAGMCRIALLGEELGITEPGTAKRLRALVRKWGLPDAIECTPEQYGRALRLDKKGEGGSIRLVALKAPGEAVLYQIKKEALLELLSREVRE
ncbi:3-dehydroquinate synthase [Papillibacter cinnamivorans]|uniref:3-dehydroquinate synthase n=1 Tax=Papillibacter cinnamivorans DSM 12816 TaxID=1122930 RepID=A0A1W2BUM9_9FIRM|nr:3-dehydroquinate synthase [Papillibacter cinnamivorans]SMC76657.1 3-dehydroquinate synthase [Papillibacter cinnamivorans DSM 12816]